MGAKRRFQHPALSKPDNKPLREHLDCILSWRRCRAWSIRRSSSNWTACLMPIGASASAMLFRRMRRRRSPTPWQNTTARVVRRELHAFRAADLGSANRCGHERQPSRRNLEALPRHGQSAARVRRYAPARLGPASPLPRPGRGTGSGRGDQRVHGEDETP